LRSLRPIDAQSYGDSCVRGQYISGQGEASYLEDIDKQSSDCETYIAIKCLIDNRRWAGTPFYLRTGKRLAGGMGEIVINFKPSNPELIKSKDGLCSNNKLVINFQPDQDIFLFINKKDNQSESFSVDAARLQLSTKGGDLKQPYERLLAHVFAGDQTLFVRDDEIEVAWKWLDQLAASWKLEGSSPCPYKCFSQGPLEADKLFVESNGWELIK
jgi:glucose-6-phosphate 1-dehydrogenase